MSAGTFTVAAAKSGTALSINPLDMPMSLIRMTGEQKEAKGASTVDVPFSIVIRKGEQDSKPVYEKLEAKLLPLAPNPFSMNAILSFRLPEKAKVQIDVFDMQGRMLETAVKGEYPGGLSQVEWAPKTRFQGLCLIRLTSGIFVSVQKGMREHID